MSILTNTNYKSWVETKALEIAKFCEQEFAIQNFVKNLVIKSSVSANRRRSSGGIRARKPFISIAARHIIASGMLNEYKFIRNHPKIGSVKGSKEKAMIALLCHELAHAVDYYTKNKNIPTVYTASASFTANMGSIAGHEEKWQRIYFILREKFLNNGFYTPHAKDEVVTESEPKQKRNLEITTTRYKNGVVKYEADGKYLCYGKRYDSMFALQHADGKLIKWLPDGKLARRWIKENLLNK